MSFTANPRDTKNRITRSRLAGNSARRRSTRALREAWNDDWEWAATAALADALENPLARKPWTIFRGPHDLCSAWVRTYEVRKRSSERNPSSTSVATMVSISLSSSIWPCNFRRTSPVHRSCRLHHRRIFSFHSSIMEGEIGPKCRENKAVHDICNPKI